MCWAMAAGLQNQEGLPGKHLRKQLAATVRNIQWSYAIFWSISTRQEGVLEWSDGYYNGDIKTRKTTQPMELKADQIGLQRSEQLRDLYESLSTGDSNQQQTRRPSASLSPEDLTDSEWYYLVCMSFTFNPGQGLPGKVLVNNHHIWLSDAPSADTKMFSRSLLAKSASIQTVVCFPFLGGVLELGTSEEVLEDPALIQHISASFWEFPDTLCSEQSISSSLKAEKDEDNVFPNLDQEIVNIMPLENHNFVAECQSENLPPAFPFNSFSPNKETELNQERVEDVQVNIFEELQTGSPDDSSNECSPNLHADDSFRMEGLNAASQVQRLQLMDNEFSNGLLGSLNSSDCIPQSFVNHNLVLSSPKGEKIKNHFFSDHEYNYTKLISADLGTSESHYTRTLSTVLRNSNQPIAMTCFSNSSLKSSFTVWRGLNSLRPHIGTPQKLLKKILFNAASMRDGGLPKPQEENSLKTKVWKPEGDDAGASHVLSERRRREKLNEKFLALRSLVPSISKVDKASILGDTIEYLKELERRVEELESCRELAEFEERERRKHPDISERTSDNYGNDQIPNGRKPSANKRKACDIDEAETDHYRILSSKDGLVDVNVTMVEKEVLIDMHCPWRDCLLFEIMNAINNLRLDAHSLQSSTTDSIFALTLKAKFRGPVVASPGMIKQVLQRVVGKC